MKTQILKYQHYLLVLIALLLANYGLMPLAQSQEEQQQRLFLLQKKASKTDKLLTNKSEFDNINQQLDVYLSDSDKYLYKQLTEAEFKLTAQSQVESILQSSGCTIQRIGFKGEQRLLPSVNKWFLEVRYKGDVSCLLKTTRALETTTPYMNIEDYYYNSRAFDKNAAADFSAVLNVSVWYKNKAANNS